MERTEAIPRLTRLIGKDLRQMADKYQITVFKEVKTEDNCEVIRHNKGWAGHVVERFLGLPMNSSRAPNFGSWELKVIPVHYRGEELRVKETMAITMLDPVEVLAKPFEQSHLYNKLKKIIVVARTFESKAETRSEVYSVGAFDLSDPKVFKQVKEDYQLIRNTIKNDGFAALSGRMGTLVQARTKGAGHGSVSRAFYARTRFVAHIIGHKPLDL